MTLPVNKLKLPVLVNQTWEMIRQLNDQERLILARLLLDSVVSLEIDEEADWRNLSLASFADDWDNPEDAVYDNWRKEYGVSTG